VLALLLASPSTAFRPTTIAPLDPCLGHETSVKAEAPFVEKVWRLILWERGKPKLTTVLAYRDKLRCAGPGNRKALKRRWRSSKRAFREHRKLKLEQRRYLEAITPPGADVLATIAACESGGNPAAVSPSGAYRGKYQFDYRTWASVGGSGDPAAAPEREQDERAAQLYRERGSSPWPVCGV
jgi:hypothetical protein